MFIENENLTFKSKKKKKYIVLKFLVNCKNKKILYFILLNLLYVYWHVSGIYYEYIILIILQVCIDDITTRYLKNTMEIIVIDADSRCILLL